MGKKRMPHRTSGEVGPLAVYKYKKKQQEPTKKKKRKKKTAREQVGDSGTPFQFVFPSHPERAREIVPK